MTHILVFENDVYTFKGQYELTKFIAEYGIEQDDVESVIDVSKVIKIDIEDIYDGVAE